MESWSLPVRALVGLLLAVLTGVFVFFVLMFIGIGFGSYIRVPEKSNLVGWSMMVVTPAGALGSGVVAFLAQLPRYGAYPWLRMIIVPFVFIFAGGMMYALMAS
jgi:hypothetical protein